MADASRKVKKKKTRARYGDYCLMIGGELFASVNIPIGGGKYKQKRKKVSNATEARQWALDEIDKATHGSIVVERSTTFAEVAAWYRREFLVAPVFENGIKLDGVKDHKKLRAKLDRITEYFGGRQINTLTEHDMTGYVRHRRATDGVTMTTINRDLALIRAMFLRAKSVNKLLSVPRFPINKAAEVERDRVMSFDEEMRLMAACVDTETIDFERKGKSGSMTIPAKRSHLAGIIIFAVDTAMRANEIFKLEWSDVDLERDILTVQFFNSKTQKTRQIGMTPRVKAVLLDLAAGQLPTGIVFTSGRPSRAFRTACTRAKIKDLHFHDLRHTATTRMIRAGVPHTEVMKITGHTQIKTFLRYLNLGSDAVQNAATLLGQYTSSVTVVESDTIN